MRFLPKNEVLIFYEKALILHITNICKKARKSTLEIIDTVCLKLVVIIAITTRLACIAVPQVGNERLVLGVLLQKHSYSKPALPNLLLNATDLPNS